MKLYFYLLCSVFLKATFGQNLVENNSFEEVDFDEMRKLCQFKAQGVLATTNYPKSNDQYPYIEEYWDMVDYWTVPEEKYILNPYVGTPDLFSNEETYAINGTARSSSKWLATKRGEHTVIELKEELLPNADYYIDSLRNGSIRKNQIFFQFGGIYSVSLGLERMPWSKKKISLRMGTGFWVDFIRFNPPSFELMIHTSLAYNFNRKNAIFIRPGYHYAFNLWYKKNPEFYFPDCVLSRCPEDINTFFVNLGYERIFCNRLGIEAFISLNYEKVGYLYGGLRFSYKF